jgi:hypothetical protein
MGPWSMAVHMSLTISPDEVVIRFVTNFSQPNRIRRNEPQPIHSHIVRKRSAEVKSFRTSILAAPAVDALMEKRKGFRVGIPRLLNTYTYAPMFNAYFANLGLGVVNLTGSNACLTVTATPETVKAAFTKGSDIFSENRITYLDPILNLQDQRLCADQGVGPLPRTLPRRE